MDGHSNIAAMMQTIGENAKEAATALVVASTEAKNSALREMAASLRNRKPEIMAENDKDMAAGAEKGLTTAMLDRLKLDEDRIEGVAAGLEAIAGLVDPVGSIESAWDRPNGLQIERVRVPLGVIGVIYESRPNVTADAGGLCLKAGNAAILRGGSESFYSSRAIMSCLSDGLRAANLPEHAIQLVPVTDRAAVGEMLRMTDYIDVIVPRGGKSLIQRVSDESKVPLFKHLEGLCHTYVHEAANPEMALDIVVNAKMRRTGICGAMENLLIDRAIASGQLTNLVNGLVAAGCEVRGDPESCALDSRIIAASAEDWDTEYLDSIVSVKQVDGIDDAISFIRKHGSDHTEAIITDDAAMAETFVNNVDSAIVMINASTQFADGGEFGMGAEIGISTGKLHARGPVGVEQLTSMKYIVRGTGQTRP
ncbi:glutamate-5-semialdehyde dehydrogenase [Rhodospirillales bacterium]|nr:glutamate-5-semialdehyde dehydrogenase [Rhodospirillales bacterium]